MTIQPDASTSPPEAREDSHAFSLEALSARDAERSGAPAPSDSGVIDLEALRLAGSVADDLTTRRLVATPTPSASTRASAPRWAWASVGVLGGAVTALAAILAVGVPHGTSAVRDPAPRPTMSVAAVDTEAPARQMGLDVALIPHEIPTTPVPATEKPEPEPEPEPKAKPRARTKRASSATPKAPSKPARAKPPAAASEPAPKPAAPPVASPPVASGNPSVSCILDPASCGMGTPQRAPKATAESPTSRRPEKLSTAQIRSGLSGPKAEAKQCADMHAAPAGTTVKVRLSIAGSGEVRSATAQAPHADSLGRCVANALSKAEFSPFGAAAMGVVYSVRL